jgi:hypothetical protein
MAEKRWGEEVFSMDGEKASEAIEDPNAAIVELEILLDKYDWFRFVSLENKRIVVYVVEMTSDILSIIPNSFCGYSVIVAFDSYANCGEKYATGGSGKSVMRNLLSVKEG